MMKVLNHGLFEVQTIAIFGFTIWFYPMYTKFQSASLPGSAENELMEITLLEKTIWDLYAKLWRIQGAKNRTQIAYNWNGRLWVVL